MESLKQNYFAALSCTDLRAQVSPTGLKPATTKHPFDEQSTVTFAEVGSGPPTQYIPTKMTPRRRSHPG